MRQSQKETYNQITVGQKWKNISDEMNNLNKSAHTHTHFSNLAFELLHRYLIFLEVTMTHCENCVIK